jgi:hypothetical protein
VRKFPSIFRFSGAILPILGQKIRNFLQKPISRDGKLGAINHQIFIKNGDKTTKKIFRKIPEI